MTSSCPHPSASTHNFFLDGQMGLQDTSDISPDGYCGTSAAHAHTASIEGLSWPLLSTLTDFEHELSGNYLTSEAVDNTSVDVGTYYGYDPTTPALAPINALPYAADAAFVPHAGGFPIQSADGVEGPYSQWFATPLDSSHTLDALPEDPSAYPLVPHQSTYSAIADALTDPTATASQAALYGALDYASPTQYNISETESELSSPVPSTSHPHADMRAHRRFKSTSPYPMATPGSSSSRGSSPQSPILSSRRNAPATAAAYLSPAPSNDPWQCPYCPWIQKSKRSPDLKRHIKTHLRPEHLDEPEWICCGVPLVDAHAKNLPTAVTLEEPFAYAGEAMVGGCRKVFSRRDALMRHLRLRKGVCYGDANAPYLRGNVKESEDH
ncbi:hypothetical protein ACG7TL_007190 [Trametes sanguinea]